MNILNLKKIIPILIVITVITGLNVFAPGEPTPLQCFLASLILVMGFIPTFLHIHKNEPGIPFLPLFGAIYSIYYALPIFILKKYTVRLIPLPEDSLTKALVFAAIGLFMLLLAYYKIPDKSIGRVIPRISIYWDLLKARFWAIILGILGLIFSYLRLTTPIPVQFAQIALFLSELLLIAVGILFILQLQGRLHRTGKILLWILFLPSIFMFRLGTGSIAPALLLGIFLLLTDWSFRRKIPWKLASGMLLLFIFFSSVKKEFRYLTWGEEVHSSKNPVEKSILFVELACTNNKAKSPAITKLASTGKIAPDKGYTVAENHITNILYKGCTVAANRIVHSFSTFAYVVDLTPKTIPYWMGQSYRALLWTPIPRVICPWKPTITLGQEFGHRYTFLDPKDCATSWNLPQTVEMYVNFGVIGVVIGMFIMGIIYRALYEMFCHPKAGEGGILIGIFVFTKLSVIEADFATVFGNIAYFIILLVFVNQLLKGNKKSSA